MPLSAPTAPPCGPAVGMTGEDDGELGLLLLLAGRTVGAVVVSAPIRTSTWFAATEVLAAAVTPNADAIRLALAASPVP